MPYPVLPAGRYGSGTPIDIADGSKLWGGTDKTNGFLMRSVDGRIPALEESFAKALAGASNPLFDSGVLPWGNALWLDLATIHTQPHTVRAEKPAKAKIAGVLKFEQGWQTGNPVQNWGLPLYSRGTVIRDGLVGYKVALNRSADPEDYLSYLRGDESKDNATIRTTYEEWVDALRAADDGSNLGIFFDKTSGFPVVAVVPPVGVLSGSPGATYDQGDFTQSLLLAGAAFTEALLDGVVFGGMAKVFEPENKAVYFDLKL
jgi:hypothetical protein